MAEFTANDCGCYFDGARGFKDIAIHAIEFAKTCGFAVSDDDFMLAKSEADETDNLYWLLDDAEEYLNEHCAPDNCYFGSNENSDWGLWANDDTGDDCDA